MTDKPTAARRLGSWIVISMLLGLLLVACSDNPTPTTAPNPTATPVTNPNPTPTSAPVATATVVPPTATAVPPTATPMPKPAEPLYLSIIINLHMPSLGSDTGNFHSLRDYYGLVAQLEKNPGVKLTFSLSGSLLQQLDQTSATNSADQFETVSKKNAALLTNDDKLFMLGHFFDVSEAQIVRFPRYLDLRRKRGDRVDTASLGRVLPLFTEEDWRDLQVMYNLASLPPEMQQTDPVRSIVIKVVGFSEEDKSVILGLQSKINGNVLEKYQQLQKSGQIEVITTPYAYPVVPLLVNNAAARDLPDADKTSLPAQPFAFPADVSAQLKKSQDLIKAKFGVNAAGFMPPEGAVSQDSLPLFKQAGANWIVSDESVLARSLGLNSFSRDANQLAQQSGQLYQPYLVAPGDLTAFFRDQALSDLMSGGYAGKPAKDAAQDFVMHLKAIQPELKKEGLADSDPRVVTLVLDGATAFNGYANNGNDFLAELYTALAAQKNIKAVTPGEFIKLRPATAKLSKVATGSWGGADFDQWIGQPDKNKAWSYLAQARSALDPYIKGDQKVDAAKLDKATQWLYQAQASEIFQSFGSTEIDTALGADQAFRGDLSSAFTELGVAPPDFLKVPITPNLARNPTRPVADFITPTINGRVSDAEWEDAGLFSETGNALAPTPDITPQGRFADLPAAPTVVAQTKTASGAPLYLTSTYYGWDDKNIYLRVDANQTWAKIDPLATIDFYLGSSKITDDSRLSYFSRTSEGKTRTPLGFGAAYQLSIQIDSKKGVTNAYLAKSLGGDSWQAVEQIEPVFGRDQTMEIAISWKTLSAAIDPGGRLYFTAILDKANTELQQVPSLGAGTIRVPDSLGLTPILDVKDKEGDDHGIGEYTYPIDRIYKPGAFDLTEFSAGVDEAKNLVMKLRIAGPLDNPLKAPYGFSLQTFDIYIRNPKSKDPASTNLLPGRNARLATAEAWQYAIVAEGWEPAIYKVDKQGKPVKTDLQLNMSVDSSDRSLTIKIPLASLGDDPENWYYLPALLGQDSKPSAGVLRVKDVEVAASLDKFGGAPNDPADGNHTRIIDTFVPSGSKTQEALLDNYNPVPEVDPSKIDTTTFAVLNMLRAKR